MPVLVIVQQSNIGASVGSTFSALFFFEGVVQSAERKYDEMTVNTELAVLFFNLCIKT